MMTDSDMSRDSGVKGVRQSRQLTEAGTWEQLDHHLYRNVAWWSKGILVVANSERLRGVPLNELADSNSLRVRDTKHFIFVWMMMLRLKKADRLDRIYQA